MSRTAKTEHLDEPPDKADRRCTIPGCEKPLECKGFCSMHYYRWRRYGDPLKLRDKAAALPVRFWAKVDKRGPDECWPWMATISRTGYGQFGIRSGRMVAAHAVAYELTVGVVPDGMQVDHRCHTESDCLGGVGCLHRRCVNPAHLEPVTARENALRGRSFSAVNAAKTHCMRGHPLSGDNLITTTQGRVCRTCRRVTQRRYELKKRRAA